ncbi:hypothetical protein Thiowin_00370 [Thiorhodovibrio winogradskyi]|uniref:Uncharacterized protein n=1 Tax=Thiorhodovibrio winogradskyi TaxID=77007 RepID=A0ABZ0S2J6_9GAMM
MQARRSAKEQLMRETTSISDGNLAKPPRQVKVPAISKFIFQRPVVGPVISGCAILARHEAAGSRF